MHIFKVKNEKVIEIKNMPSPPLVNWKDEFYDSIEIINMLRNGKDWYFSYNNEFCVFTINYLLKNIPPKTSRINFRNKIVDDGNIPIKNISFNFTSDAKILTRITYQVTKDEMELFMKNVSKIDIDNINPTHWPNLKSETKALIKNLSNIDSFETNTLIKDKNSLGSIVQVEFIAIDRKYLYEIFGKLELEIKTMDFRNISYIKIDEFNKIAGNYPWIIKSYNEPNTEIYSVPEIEIQNLITNVQLQDLLDSLGGTSLPHPTPDTPIIGVIDSAAKVPEIFKEYFESESYISQGGVHDYSHGSTVCSMIINNDIFQLNKDNYGIFRVKLFEILCKSSEKDQSVGCSYETLIESLEEIIKNNYFKIKIWNISFGMFKRSEISSVSKLGCFLDYLSNKYDVLFVVSSGNDGTKGLSSPADGFNVISVGSVIKQGNKIIRNNYSSRGQVLLYSKPEVSDFGGPTGLEGEHLFFFDGSKKVTNLQGTSFSAPKVARLAGYLLKKGLEVLEIKSMITSLAVLVSGENSSSRFGYLKPQRDDYFIKCLLEVNSNKPLLIPIDLTDVENMTVSISYNARPNNCLSDEYCFSSFEANIVGYNKSADGSISFEGQKGVIIGDRKELNSKFKNEVDLRIKDGKYFTSIKKKISLSKYPLENDKEYYLRIKKTSLYDFRNPYSVKIGIIIKFEGKNLDIKKFEERNQETLQLVNVDLDIEIDV